MKEPDTTAQADGWRPQPTSQQRPNRQRRRRNRRRWLRVSHETHALEQLRAAHPDRVISWSVPAPGHRGGWLALSFTLADPVFQEIGLSHAAWAPNATQLDNRIAAQNALAAGVGTTMSLHPPADHGTDPLARVRAELAPLAREVLVQVLCKRAGL